MIVRVPTVEIEREIDARLYKTRKTTRLKGFRPGKVPAKVVRQRFGGQIRQEVLSDIIRESYSRAISQEQLNPASSPAIEALNKQDEEHFSYQAMFEVFPEIALKGLDGLAIESPHVEIVDSDVDAMIDKLRVQRADWQTVDRKAQPDDRVIVDFVGRVKKEPFEGGEGKEVPIVLGSGQVLADFEKALKGLAAGDEKTAKVKFPKDYGVEDLAGKKAVFDITVHRVEEQILPELDDEFLDAFGAKEGGVAKLKDDVRNNMQRELDERLKVETKTRALDALLDQNQISVPNSLVQQEISNLQGDAMRRMGIEDPEQAPPREGFNDMAGRRVMLGLLVQELVSEHNIELDRARVDDRIETLVSPYEKPHEAAQMYRGSRELMAQVESAVLEDQVVDFLLEQGGSKEKKMSFEEFMG